MPKIKPARIRARGNKDRAWRPLPGFGDGVYPVVKTDKMIQPVGRDEQGRLFTAPTGGGGGVAVETDPTVPAWAKQPDPPTYTAAEVGALPADTPIPENTSDLTNDSGYITVAVATLLNYYLKTEVYNRSEAYSRTEVDNLISGLDKRLNAIADSTDVDLDQLSEIVAYIKSNKSLIDGITTSKVSVADIVNNLTTEDAAKPLSAAQGKVLKGLYDALPAWAKAASKPTYTKSEIGLGNVDNVRQYSASNPPPYPVKSVNGKTGAVSLGASDVGARPDTWTPTASDVGALPSGTKIPAKTSDITNDSGFITKAVADLTNYYTKSQTYTQAEINALVSAIPKFAISVVASLPTSGISTTTIYLVKSGSGTDLYTEYIYTGGAWEILGSQRVDLTGYATEAWVNAKIADFLTADKLTAAMVTGALGFAPAKAADIPAVDGTLKVSGAAADAAVVGGKFTEVSEAIADLQQNSGTSIKYVIKGGTLDESYLDKIRHWNVPVNDTNIPIFRLETDKPAMTDATLTPDYLYSMFDALMAKHPQYITKYDMGLCSDGIQHIYRYDFVEPEPHHRNDSQEWEEQKLKIIIGAGIHWEWGSMFGIFNALEEITENKKLYGFRRNTHLIVIPCMNPYSALHGGITSTELLRLARQNANGVEIHRNFEVGFLRPGDSGYKDPSNMFHGGTAPLSEPESQYVDKIMRENMDAALFMSCHGFDSVADSATDDMGIGFIWVSAATAYTCNIGYRLIDKLSDSWMSDYGDTLSAGIASYKTDKLKDWDTRLGFGYMSSTNGSEQRQGTKYGIQSANVEMCNTFFVHGTKTNKEPVMSSFTMSRGTEVYINYLLMVSGLYDQKDKMFYGLNNIESIEPEIPYEPIEPGNGNDTPSESILPAEYQQVECIYNTVSGAYINTGITGHTGLEIRGKVKDYAANKYQSSQYIIGTTNAANQRCYVAYNDNTPQFELGAIGYYISDAANISEFEFTAKWTTADCTLETSTGTNISSGAVTAFDNGVNLTIWGRNKDGTVTANGVFYLYRLEIDDDGVAVRNFVPCYRKSDNVVGLYDIVNGVFYTNAGTGTFYAGEVVA